MTTLGVIRYDFPSAVTTKTAEEGILGPAAQHYRLPRRWATVTGTNTVSFNYTQATEDDCIGELAACGFDYIAIDFYPNALNYQGNSGGRALWDGIHNALDFYLASPNVNKLKFCLVLVGSEIGHAYPYNAADWTTVCDQIVALMLHPQYMKVPDGRPLLYVIDMVAFNALAPTGGMALLRSKANTAGFTFNTKIVVAGMDYYATMAGIDVTSSYACSMGGTGTVRSWATFDTAAKAIWASCISGAHSNPIYAIPTAYVGWDFRPRVTDGFWCAQLSAECTDQDYVDSSVTTDLQVATQIQDAIDFVAAHPTECSPADTVLVYAYREQSEAGRCLEGDISQVGMGKLQQIAQLRGRQRDSQRALRSRGIGLNSR